MCGLVVVLLAVGFRKILRVSAFRRGEACVDTCVLRYYLFYVLRFSRRSDTINIKGCVNIGKMLCLPTPLRCGSIRANRILRRNR